MQNIIFNSRSELDRLPCGAVAAGTKIRVGICVAAGVCTGPVFLVLRPDAGGADLDVPLSPVWSANGYDRFEGWAEAGEAGLYRYFFRCVTAEGEKFAEKADTGARLCDGVSSPWQLTVYENDYNTPDWIKGGVFYHIFVDRFRRGANRPHREGSVVRGDWGGIPNYLPDENGEIKNNDFFGGDLDGVIEKLPYLHGLGVTCVYLSPVFEAASNHKYDTSDYLRIDPAFGDDGTFQKLCAEAGKFGIRVICDGVFNHTGSDSVYFDRFGNYGGNGAYNSKSSPYFSWYNFAKWPDEYECWWNIRTLPRVRWGSESFFSFILGKDGVLEKWMSLGCSGWRLDVADELSEDFIRGLRARAKAHSEDELIIGEVWEDASNKISYGERRAYFGGGELDSVMNYPLRNGIISYMTGGAAEDLRDVVETLCENYPKPALDCLMNILGTHDTERILTALGGKTYPTRGERADAVLTGGEYDAAKNRLFCASLLQFTLPGVPCVYYGDEAGLQGYEDPFCRRCFPWENVDNELTQWYKKLGRMRRENCEFADGAYRTVFAGDRAFSFVRETKRSFILAAVNLGTADYSPEPYEGADILLSQNCESTEAGPVVRPGGCVVIKKAESF